MTDDAMQGFVEHANLSKVRGRGAMNGFCSRRAFLAGSVLAGVGLAGAGLSGCSPQGEVAESSVESPLGAPDVEMSTDVLVVGLGTAGMMAALGAAEKGVNVIGAEKVSSMAGTTNASTHGAWVVGSSLQAGCADPITIEEAMSYFQGGTNYQFSSQALRSILEASGKAADMLMKGGFTFETSPFFKASKDSPMINRGAHDYMFPAEERGPLFQRLLDNAGVETLFDTAGSSLIIEDGCVAGVRFDRKGETLDVRAKAVVLATGGFLDNFEMASKYLATGYPAVSIDPAPSTGEGVAMALEAGAQIGKTFSVVLNEYGGANEKASPQNSRSIGSSMAGNDMLRFVHFGGLLVDKNGDRFVDEGYVAENPFFSGEPLVRAGRYYAICDEPFMKRLATEPYADFFATGKMKSAAKDMVLSDVAEQFEKAQDEGWAFAGELTDVADHFGLTNLERTVEEYEACVEAGADLQLYKNPKYLFPVAKAPFYAIELQPSAYQTIGGIKCNATCQALDPQGNAIAGLYVAGGDADVYSSPYYLNGTANGFSLGSGLVAGWAAGEAVA